MRYRVWRAGVVSVFIGLAAASVANGQSLSNAINGAMNRTSTLLQQPAGAVPLPSRSESKQRKASASAKAHTSTPATVRSAGHRVPVDRNSLAAVPTTTHSLSNGVVLQVTGELVPEAKATCTDPCK